MSETVSNTKSFWQREEKKAERKAKQRQLPLEQNTQMTSALATKSNTGCKKGKKASGRWHSWVHWFQTATLMYVYLWQLSQQEPHEALKLRLWLQALKQREGGRHYHGPNKTEVKSKNKGSTRDNSSVYIQQQTYCYNIPMCTITMPEHQ